MGSQHPLQLLHLLFGWKRIVLVLVWPQIKDSQEVVLSAPPIPLLSSCAFLLQNASCLGLASGTTPKLAPAFKQIHSSFLSAGAEGGGYYPRVEMSSNGRQLLVPSAPGYNLPLHHSHLSLDWNWTSWEESFNHLPLPHIESLNHRM